MAAHEELVNRISEIADVVVMRYRLEPRPGIDFVSPSSLPILGYRPDEFYASPDLGLEIVHPEDRERLASACACDPQATFVGRAIRKDGRVRWIERRQTRVTDRRGGRAYLEATLRDVTDQHEAAEALRESDRRWRAVFESAHDIFLLADDDRVIVDANPAAAEFFGVPAEEIAGRKIDDLVSGDTELRWSMLLHEGSLRNEGVWRRGDRSERRVRVSATANVAPGLHLAVVQDITDRRAAEDALHESQLRFRTAFEQAPIGMALVAIDGAWLEVNRAFCEFLGYSQEELVQTNWQALTHPDDVEITSTHARATLAGESNGFTVEKRYLRKDGATVLGRLNVSLVQSAAGGPSYFIGQLEDITLRRPATQAVSGDRHGLTQRQVEILQLLADGKSTGQVAEELFISKTTVRNHVARLLTNLGVHTRVQAIVAASRLGLIRMPDGDATPGE